MATPRIGATGVATTKGDLYVIDTNGDLERLPVGADGDVLAADSTDPLGVKWEAPTFAQKVSWMFDAALAIFKKVTIGGIIANPKTVTRGTHAVLGFNDTTIQGIPWQAYMPTGYNGGNLRLSIYWVADTAVAGDVIWAAAFERNEAGNNVTTDNFAALQTAAASTAPGVAGVEQVATITFTQAQADGILEGEPLRLFIQRTASAVGDTMVGDAQLVRAVLEEL